MDTLQELKRQIENANALGIKNLADKGVGFAGLFPPTTYEVMQGIADIIRDGGDDSGGGVQYTSITYNEDDTITLIDTDGTPHTMVCVYEDDKLKSVIYDSKEIKLHYIDDALDMIGNTVVDLSGYWYIEKRAEMEITGAITIINNQYVGTTKTYDDMCIAGYMGNNWKSPFIVSEMENGIAVNSSSSMKNTTTVEYENKTYYVRYDKTTDWSTSYTQFDSRFYACSSTEINSAVIELLDHYFVKDEVAE